MAKRTITKRTADRTISHPASARRSDFFSQIKWGESYTSLILGAIVVIIGLILIFSFLKSRSLVNQQATSTSTDNEQSANSKPKNYTVVKGDHLWSISEKIYGSGYNWVDIAKANKITQPSVLFTGTKLVIPDVEAKQVTVIQQNTQNTQAEQTNPIKGDSYAVVKGDNLWQVSVRAYGDGYKWVQVAKANNLINPNVIHPGNKLKLPR